MATIRDMAIEAYPIIENGAFKQSQMEYEVEIKQKRGAYFNGANAVLEKIEKALDLGEPPYLISVERAYYITEKLIRELKGE